MPDREFRLMDLRLAVEMRVDLELRFNHKLARWEAIILYRELLKHGLLLQFDTVKTSWYSRDVQFLGWDSEESDLQTFAIVDPNDSLIHVFQFNC